MPTLTIAKNKITDNLLLLLSQPYLRWMLQRKFRGQIYDALQKLKKLEIQLAREITSSEVVVFYRISPYSSRKKSPVYPNDKFKLTQYCLDSFSQAFKDTKSYVVFLLDSCPPPYHQLIKTHCQLSSTIIPLNQIGNLASFYLQIKLACQLHSSQLVYLAEDDYFYLPNAGQQLESALRKVPFATLYDHPDSYTKWLLKHQPYTKRIVNGRTWRTVASTTLTFGAQVKALKATKDIWLSNPFSTPNWFSIRELGYHLYAVTPSLATHMVKDYLPPLVSWDTIWQNTEL